MYVWMNGQVQQQLEEVNSAPAAPSVGRAMVLRKETISTSMPGRS